MPTLLQINVTSNWGSTGKIAEQIGVLAQQSGWDSYIAYGRYANPSRLNTIKIGNIVDVYEHFIENRFLNREGLASRKATKKFLKQIDDINPDIVHLHNIHDHYLNYKLLFEYLAKKKIPVVWTQHDCWAFTGHCAHFDHVKCERWKNKCHHCPLKKQFSIDRSSENFRLKQKLFTSLNSLTIVPVSDWLGNLVKESFLKNQSIRVIKNGIDIDVFKPQINGDLHKKYGFGSQKYLIGCASIWDARKGLADYIELSKCLSDEYQLVLVGLSKKQIEKLPSTIIGIERTNNVQELAQLYSMASVVLNLSYQETFGLTTVEGFACGTPSIVYNKTASPELISSETGFVVEAGDFKRIIQSIEYICSKGKDFYSKACRERAVKFYNKNNRFQDYINLYNELINNN